MASPKFEYSNRRVDTSKSPDFGKLRGKTVVITGGSSGLGLCYCQALIKAGAFVINGDIKPPAEQEDSENLVFVKCDVTNWEEQVNVFQVAKDKSPSNAIDAVIANAGIYGPDALDGIDDEELKRPVTGLLDVNLIGVLYTSKLAGWHFHHQPVGHDRCLILVSSIMGYIDTQGSSVYSASKHGVRGLLTCLRRKGLVRVNGLAPWFVATPILPDAFIRSTGSQFKQMGVDFAQTEDAVSAVVRLITDTAINGRTLGVVPRQLACSGYMDLDRDDYEEGSKLRKMQDVASGLVYGSFGKSE